MRPKEVTVLLAAYAKLNLATERVRELHKLVKENNAACGDPECCGEYEEWEECEECRQDHPCPTIKALDGEQ